MKKKMNIQKLITNYVFYSLLISFIYLVVRVVFAPSTDESVLVKSEYMLMLAQCFLGIIAMLLPNLVRKNLKLEIPSGMLVLYVIFLYCAIFLGEVRSFYYNFPRWDDYLHMFSGGMLGALGFSIISLLNKTDEIPLNLSPIFVAVFAFCFAITVGVVWEFYEHTFDGILGLNMQKFALEDGTQLIGREALADTMHDLYVDALGAFIMCAIGYVSLKYKQGWIEGLLLKKKK